MSGTSIANSSPPKRQTRSVLRTQVEQFFSDELEGRISGGVTIGVVELFEVVGVDHQQRDRVSGTIRVPLGIAQDVGCAQKERAAVDEAGEFIGLCQPAQSGVRVRKLQCHAGHDIADRKCHEYRYDGCQIEGVFLVERGIAELEEDRRLSASSEIATEIPVTAAQNIHMSRFVLSLIRK